MSSNSKPYSKPSTRGRKHNTPTNKRGTEDLPLEEDLVGQVLQLHTLHGVLGKDKTDKVAQVGGYANNGKCSLQKEYSSGSFPSPTTGKHITTPFTQDGQHKNIALGS